MATTGIEVVGLREFRRALQGAATGATRQLSTAIRKAGAPIVEDAQSRARAHHRTGRHERGFAIRARGTAGDVINREPYAGGAEWGRAGRWRGFQRSGPPGERFAGGAVDEKAEEVQIIITTELGDVISIQGWAG